MSTSIVEMWKELKILMEAIEVDVKKNAQGNKSAGVRARKGLRQVKKSATDIVKSSIESDRS